MKPLLLTSFLIVQLLSGVAFAQQSDQLTNYQEAYATWERAAFEEADQTSHVAYEGLREAWREAPESLRTESAYYYAQAAIRTARDLVAIGDLDQAAETLKDAGAVAENYPVVLSRGRTSAAFENLASVHASVVDGTTSDPLEDVPTGYELWREDDGFIALQKSLDSERTTSSAAPSEIEGLVPNESAGTLLMIDSKGEIIAALPVAIANGSGPLRERLSAIFEYKPAGPDGPAQYDRLEPDTFLANTKNGAKKEMSRPTDLQSEPTFAKKASTPDKKSTEPEEGDVEADSNPFPYWIFIIGGVVVIGLVVLLRRR